MILQSDSRFQVKLLLCKLKYLNLEVLNIVHQIFAELEARQIQTLVHFCILSVRCLRYGSYVLMMKRKKIIKPIYLCKGR